MYGAVQNYTESHIKLVSIQEQTSLLKYYVHPYVFTLVITIIDLQNQF